MSARDIVMLMGGAASAPADPYFSNVVLLNHFDTNFADSSLSSRTVTPVGMVVSSALSKFGGGSAQSNSSQYATISPTIVMSGNFTVEAWIYQTAYSSGSYPVIFFGPANVQMMLDYGGNGKLAAYLDGTTIQSATSPFTLNQWNHVAWVRSGSTVTIYYNGTPVASGSHTASVSIAQHGYASSGPNLIGYRDDCRITNGVARYTGPFTPPDVFPNA